MFCYTMEANLAGSVLNFEGIDPPLLDPGMVELFQTAQKSTTLPGATTTRSEGASEGKSLENMTTDDLAKLVAQLCEADPSLTEQILAALNISPDEITQALFPDQVKAAPKSPSSQTTSSPETKPQSSPNTLNNQESSIPLNDTSSILKTLNQSLLLQDLNKVILPAALATTTSSSSTFFDTSLPQNSTVIIPSEDTLASMKSNLFIMEKQTNTFVPMTNRDGTKKPKYTRKNFSPEQIQG